MVTSHQVVCSFSNDDQMMNKNLNPSANNTDLDTMEAAHVLATAADVTMAADATSQGLNSMMMICQ